MEFVWRAGGGGLAASDFIVDIINICVNYPPDSVGTNPKKTRRKMNLATL